MRAVEIEAASERYVCNVCDDVDEVSRGALGTLLQRAFIAGATLVPPPERAPSVIGSPKMYATCPGCGQRGDVAHLAACRVERKDAADIEAWYRGATYALAMVRTQVGRRGAVDMGKLVDAIEAMHDAAESAGRIKYW